MKLQNSIFTTKTLNRAAILIAMSVVLKSFLSIEGGVFRVTFFDIPLIILGLMLGPLIAIVAGFVVDWIYVLISPFAFSFNLMTLSTISWALIPALFLFKRKKVSLFKISMVVLFTSLIAFSLNTLQLYIWAGVGAFGDLPLRIGILFVKLPIQIIVIHVLYQRVIALELNILKER
ncbi:MAG: folate family ECF transporter S component [Bacilli bacterium]|nr:folate family ECF transporter S component [Bacilli bacterium]